MKGRKLKTQYSSLWLRWDLPAFVKAGGGYTSHQIIFHRDLVKGVGFRVSIGTVLNSRTATSQKCEAVLRRARF